MKAWGLVMMKKKKMKEATDDVGPIKGIFWHLHSLYRVTDVSCCICCCIGGQLTWIKVVNVEKAPSDWRFLVVVLLSDVSALFFFDFSFLMKQQES